MTNTVHQNLSSQGEVSAKGVRPSDEDVLRQLNALKITGNFVSALIRFPGPASNKEQAVAAARAMVQAAEKTTASLLDDLGIGNESWKRYRVMRMVSEAVASHWRATASEGAPTADVEHMRPVWVELSKFDLPLDPGEEVSSDPATAMRIAVLEAMAPVTREIGVFSLFHEPAAAARHARDVILAVAHEAKTLLSGNQASATSSLNLLTSLLRNAGPMYAATWRRHGESVLEHLYSLPAEERAAKIASEPNGFPIDPIDSAFIEAFGRLTEMVEYLAPVGGPSPVEPSQRGRERLPGDASVT